MAFKVPSQPNQAVIRWLCVPSTRCLGTTEWLSPAWSWTEPCRVRRLAPAWPVRLLLCFLRSTYTSVCGVNSNRELIQAGENGFTTQSRSSVGSVPQPLLLSDSRSCTAQHAQNSTSGWTGWQEQEWGEEGMRAAFFRKH